jgi:thiol:disulfide interchange protein DsbD
MTLKISSLLICASLLIGSSSYAQFGSRASSNFLNSAQPQPLPLEQAFPFYVSIQSPIRLNVSWTIAEAHYLYRHRFAFAIKQSAEAEPVPVDFTLPDGIAKSDQFFGDIEAYYDSVTAAIPVPENSNAAAILVIEYQGCADWGFCYPPQIAEYRLQP